MGFTKKVMLFLSTMTVLSFFMITLGATFVYKVGDDAGWKMGSANLDYHTWAAKKFFHVGDILGKSALFITLFFTLFFFFFLISKDLN